MQFKEDNVIFIGAAAAHMQVTAISNWTLQIENYKVVSPNNENVQDIFTFVWCQMSIIELHFCIPLCQLFEEYYLLDANDFIFAFSGDKLVFKEEVS